VLLAVQGSSVLTSNMTLLPFAVSPLHVSPPGRFAHSLDVSPPSAFLCVCCFLEHQNVTDGWTDRIAINISRQCGDAIKTHTSDVIQDVIEKYWMSHPVLSHV